MSKVPWNKGLKLPEVYGQLISDGMVGKKRKPFSDEHKKNIGKASKNRKYPEQRKSRTLSDEHKRKLSTNKKEYWNNLSESERKNYAEKATKNRSISFKYRDTKPELKFEQILISKNILYEKQKSIGKYFADFYLPKFNMIIEIQGCYTHCCEICGNNDNAYGVPANFVRSKDLKRKEYLESFGYKVQFIWDHQL